MSEPLKEFARAMIRDSWEGGDNADFVQSTAERLGLIKRVKYNPKKHPATAYAELGEDWYEFAAALSASDQTDAFGGKK